METIESGQADNPKSEPERPAKRLLFKPSSTIGIIAASATMLGTVAAFISYRYQGRDVAERYVMEERERAVTIRMAAMAAELNAMRHELRELQVANVALRTTLEKSSNSGKAPHYAGLSPEDRQELKQVEADESQLGSRFAALETTLGTAPEKAIAVPMLKQQIDTLQDRLRADLDSFRGEIGRLFTLTQWFIGLMFTIALGVFGLALSHLRNASEKPPSEKERSSAS